MNEPGSGRPKVLAEIDGRGIAALTLNRPEKGNCYDGQMLGLIQAQVAALAGGPRVRAIVLRGAGKHFCVGAEIGRPGASSGAAAGSSAGPRLTEVLAELDRAPKPTIALVHGACVGGGLAFACCCDIVLAASDAFFSIPEVRIGFSPGALLPFFARAMGARSLRRYALSGERFTAQEALRMGVVHEVCEAAALDARLPEVLEGILLGGPVAVGATKAALARFAERDIPQALLAELEREFERARESAEAREGRASFLEKRKPSWYPTR